MVLEVCKHLDSPLDMEELMYFMQRVEELKEKEITSKELEMRMVKVTVKLPRIVAIAVRYYAELVKQQTIEQLFLTKGIQRLADEIVDIWGGTCVNRILTGIKVIEQVAKIVTDTYNEKHEEIQAKNGSFVLTQWYTPYTQKRTQQELLTELQTVINEINVIPLKEWKDEKYTEILPDYNPRNIDLETVDMVVLLPQLLITAFKLHSVYTQELNLDHMLREFISYAFDMWKLFECVNEKQEEIVINNELLVQLKLFLTKDNKTKIYWFEHDFVSRHHCVLLDEKTRKRYDY